MSFLERAKRFGHDVEAIRRGATVTSTIVLNTIEDYREFMAAHLSDDHRRNYSARQAAEPEQGPAQRALSDHIFGTGELTAEARVLAEEMLPLEVALTSSDTYTVDNDVEYGTQSVAINAGTLVIDGGSLTIRGGTLTIHADNLLMKAASAKQSYVVGVLGIAGADGAAGATGADYDGGCECWT